MALAMKPKGMTKAQGRAFRRRWKAVNAAEIEELRSTPAAQKFRQLAALMVSAKELGWSEELAAEEAQVRELWNRLRKAYGL